MNRDNLTNIAHRWIDAFNKRDLNRLLELYDDEAQHFSPKLKMRQPATGGLIKGKNLLHDWWQDAFLRLPTLEYTLLRVTPFENRVFIEYNRHVAGEEDLYVGEMFETNDNGKIITSMVFHR